MLTRSLALAVASLGLLASTAKADIITGTFSGTLGSGATDTLGVFAPSGTNLAGMSFSGGFSIDTLETGPTTSCSSSFPCERTSGKSPSSSLALTIDGTTFTLTGNANAVALASQPTSPAATNYQVAVQKSLNGAGLVAAFSDPSRPGNPATLLTDIDMDATGPFGLFTVVVNGSGVEQLQIADYSLTVLDRSAVAVPEPSGWMVAFSGLAMLGLLLRGRERA